MLSDNQSPACGWIGLVCVCVCVCVCLHPCKKDVIKTQAREVFPYASLPVK